MKSSAWVFLTAFLALAGSWGGFVLAPQIQLGRGAQATPTGSNERYPLARSGLARQGAEVYRANGCVYCHSQQVGQEGTRCDVVLMEAGTNAAVTLAAVTKLNAELGQAGAKDLLANLPKVISHAANASAGSASAQELQAGGGKAEVRIVPIGSDMTRGWGRRRSVAQDYLWDYPVQLGTRRVGPDLANVGVRKPDAAWHLRHLYSPPSETKGSTMPPYRYLFETRRIGHEVSPDALQLSGELAPAPGYEVVPTAEGKALAAYLVSLSAEAPLFEAPVSLPSKSATTNTTVATAPAK